MSYICPAPDKSTTSEAELLTSINSLANSPAGEFLRKAGGVLVNATPAGAGGDVSGPATNTDGYIPLWDGADSKTLKNGIATTTFALTAQTMYIGTTSVAINRATAALSLAGVDIDGSSASCTGNAATVTNGVYTSSQVTVLAASDAGDKDKYLHANAATGAIEWSAVSGTGADTDLGNLASVAINTSLISDTDITDDLGTGDIRWKDIYSQTLSAGLTAADTLKLRGYDVDGTAFIDILTITSNNTVTADLNAITTIGSNAIIYSGGALGTPSGGTLTSCTGLPVSGITASTATALGVGSLELGHASDTTLTRSAAGVLAVEGVVIPSISSTNTLTNKRITKRVVTTTDDATAAINTDTTDVYELSAIANATVFTLTGTPTDKQTLLISFKDAGTTKGLTWTGFTAIGVTLPTTTVAGKWHYVGCVYNLAATAWHAIAVSEES